MDANWVDPGTQIRDWDVVLGVEQVYCSDKEAWAVPVPAYRVRVVLAGPYYRSRWGDHREADAGTDGEQQQGEGGDEVGDVEDDPKLRKEGDCLSQRVMVLQAASDVQRNAWKAFYPR